MTDAVWLFFATLALATPGVLTGSVSFLTIPLLMHFGLDPRRAVATNKPGILMMGLTGATGFRHRYREVPRTFWPMAPLMFAGGVGGAEVLRHLPGTWIRTVVLVLVLVAAVPWRRRAAHAVAPNPTSRTTNRPILETWGLITLIALYNGLLGPGTMTLIISIFRFRLGLPIRTAIAWGNLMAACGNLGATLRYFTAGLVHPGYALAMMFGTSLGAQIGVRMGHRLPGRALEWSVRIVLLALGLGLVIQWLQ